MSLTQKIARREMPGSLITTLSNSTILRKCLGRPFMVANQRLWNRLPRRVRSTRPMRTYGKFLHHLVRLRSERKFNFGTHFFRNRAQLEMIRQVADKKRTGDTLRIAVLACSKGAEVYSVLWTISSARPDLNIILHAVDISKEVVEFAQKGVYSRTKHEFVNAPVFDRISEAEMKQMFDVEGDQVVIKQWLKKGISWHVGDAGDVNLINVLGPQDIVLANTFLCHMRPTEAESCLRNLVQLVTPGGTLFVSGVDLEVRTKVALDLNWTPLPDSIEEIHNGDPVLINDWPWKYWGLEPLDKRRSDWKVRYATAFQIGKDNRNEVS